MIYYNIIIIYDIYIYIYIYQKVLLTILLAYALIQTQKETEQLLFYYL